MSDTGDSIEGVVPGNQPPGPTLFPRESPLRLVHTGTDPRERSIRSVFLVGKDTSTRSTPQPQATTEVPVVNTELTPFEIEVLDRIIQANFESYSTWQAYINYLFHHVDSPNYFGTHEYQRVYKAINSANLQPGAKLAAIEIIRGTIFGTNLSGFEA